MKSIRSGQLPPKRFDPRIALTLVLLFLMVVSVGFGVGVVVRHPMRTVHLRRVTGAALLTGSVADRDSDTSGNRKGAGSTAAETTAAAQHHEASFSEGGGSLEAEVMGDDSGAVSAEDADDDDDDADDTDGKTVMADENGVQMEAEGQEDSYESPASMQVAKVGDDDETWGEDDTSMSGEEGATAEGAEMAADGDDEEADVETAAAGSLANGPDSFFRTLTTDSTSVQGGEDDEMSSEIDSDDAPTTKASAIPANKTAATAERAAPIEDEPDEMIAVGDKKGADSMTEASATED